MRLRQRKTVGRLSEASNGKSSCVCDRGRLSEAGNGKSSCRGKKDYGRLRILDATEKAILVRVNARSINLNIHQEINTLSLNKAKNINLDISEEEDQEEDINEIRIFYKKG
ncbi:3973_t:CDS:2 [Acaulospora morrowiae]|uniref:3973_t:CDS:1 n=1 Tax=Acaulospora morrowiae TaxID=94023 RepID=A0A9N9G951_9GLOM|nr:3973_t:CDS:2 [Acaulospora morrowiae]